MISKKHIKILILVVSIILISWLFFYPCHDYVEGPGDANNLSQMVSMKGQHDTSSGQFMLTTVSIAPAHPYSYLLAKVNHNYSIESSHNITGGENNRNYNRVQSIYMKTAINEAINVAFKKAHRFVCLKNNGIYVLDVLKNSDLKNRVQVGDTIITINHHHFNQDYKCQHYLSRFRPGPKLWLSYKHGHKIKHSVIRIIKIPHTDRTGMGIILTDNNTAKTHDDVKVDSERIGGPSGGLMLALQMYNQISRANLKKGRKIAGTGTITSNGQIGEIGGIDKKIVAAKRKGATIFLAPYVKPTKRILRLEPNHMTNYELAVKTARKDAPHMKVVPVSNFQDAIDYLR